jgi:hypothetical protein
VNRSTTQTIAPDPQPEIELFLINAFYILEEMKNEEMFPITHSTLLLRINKQRRTFRQRIQLASTLQLATCSIFAAELHAFENFGFPKLEPPRKLIEKWSVG